MADLGFCRHMPVCSSFLSGLWGNVDVLELEQAQLEVHLLTGRDRELVELLRNTVQLPTWILELFTLSKQT